MGDRSAVLRPLVGIRGLSRNFATTTERRGAVKPRSHDLSLRQRYCAAAPFDLFLQQVAVERRTVEGAFSPRRRFE